MRNGIVHPIHLHGHRFQVLKMEFSKLYPHTKLYAASNNEYCCVSNDTGYDQVTWCDRAWLDGNVPDIIESGAPYKETLAVPAGGYAVVRIYTDNPGIILTIIYMPQIKESARNHHPFSAKALLSLKFYLDM